MSETMPKRRWRVSRRGFLVGAGLAGGAAAVGYIVGLPFARLKMTGMLDNFTGVTARIDKAPTLWIDIGRDEVVTFHIPKVEMGQGVHTALAQILAEELGANWEQVRVMQSGTANGPFDSTGTIGSLSVTSLWSVLREVAGNMREMLREEAARQFGVQPSKVSLRNGEFALGGDTRTFGQVVALHQGQWLLPKTKPTLKPVADFTIVGKSMGRVDLPSKVTGAAIYGYDVRVPGMLYGAVARPPTIEGKLRRVREGTAASQPGVVKVVIDEHFAGVVAHSRAEAAAGVKALDLEWDEGRLWNQDEIEKLLDVDLEKGVVVQNEGSATAALTGNVIEARYSTPLAAHANLEAQAAMADVRGNRARLWVSTQQPADTRHDVAHALGFKESDVDIMPTYLGGGFGRKYGSDVAVDAALLSKAVGKPVHVGFSREEEFHNGFFRQPSRHVLRATLSDAGRVEAMTHLLSAGPVFNDLLPSMLIKLLGSDFGIWRGAPIHYGIAKRYTAAQLVKLPVLTGWWRGLGLLPNTFAVESFMDELSHAAKADPLAFRLAHVPPGDKGERYKAALNAVADRSGWGTPPASGRGRGVAICIDGGTVCAQVAEVSIETGDGGARRIRVHKVWSAIDPGFIVNPNGVIAQSEGAITMGISSALIEEVRIANGRVEADNFGSYPLITMRETPDIEIILLQSGPLPTGVGEPPIGPISAAIGNAVFDLTGQRLRALPLRLA